MDHRSKQKMKLEENIGEVVYNPCVCVCVCVCVYAKSCLTLCDFMDYSLPSSSVHDISRQEY